jgi:hypothetical protein
MSLEWDKLYKLGTDVAGFMFFHPARLAHRKDSPTGWWSEEFAEEFRAGRLVAFCTGSDGKFTMKFVRRPMSPAEKGVLVVKQSFRYEVLEGRVYWDNDSSLPCDDRFDNAEDDKNGWLDLPNGQYRVTVHALDWFTISDVERKAAGDISHYVVRFEPVSSLEEIPVPKDLPWLLPSKSCHEARVAQLSGSKSQN